MINKTEKYIKAIIEAKWGEKNVYWIPTDIIWFDEFGQALALALEKYVWIKEICFFDEKIKNSNKYHYLDFNNMFEKTEVMIFTKELPSYYFENIKSLNPNVTIIVDSKFKTTIEILKWSGFSNNIIEINN